jgi:hypothetical protein
MKPLAEGQKLYTARGAVKYTHWTMVQYARGAVVVRNHTSLRSALKSWPRFKNYGHFIGRNDRVWIEDVDGNVVIDNGEAITPNRGKHNE